MNMNMPLFMTDIEKGERHLVQAGRRFGGLDGELHRQPERAGKRGLLEYPEFLRRQFIEVLLQDVLDLSRSEFALAARHQRHANEGLAGGVNLKYRHDPCLGFDDVEGLIAGNQFALQGRVGCGGWLRQHEALVFLRRKLAARAAIQEENAGHDDDHEQCGDRRIAQTGLEAPLIAGAEALEARVDEFDDAAFPSPACRRDADAAAASTSWARASVR